MSAVAVDWRRCFGNQRIWPSSTSTRTGRLSHSKSSFLIVCGRSFQLRHVESAKLEASPTNEKGLRVSPEAFAVSLHPSTSRHQFADRLALIEDIHRPAAAVDK